MNKQSRGRIQKLLNTLGPMVDEINDLAAEETEAWENLPESLASTANAERMEGAVESLDAASVELDGLISSLADAQGV